jgi:hypothetical protein
MKYPQKSTLRAAVIAIAVAVTVSTARTLEGGEERL